MSHEVDSPDLSRRRFLVGAGAVIAGGGLAATAAAARGFDEVHAPVVPQRPFSASAAERLGGAIASLEPRRLWLGRAPSRQVALTPHAWVWRDRPSTLAAFSVGEKVIAEGSWDGSVFVATALTNVYVSLRAEVVAVNGDHLTTTSGPLRFVDETRNNQRPASPADFRPGERVSALGREEPGTPGYVVLYIAVTA